MHKIYVDNGIFDFIYFIPIFLYSIIISSIINMIIKSLSLSQSNIAKIKNEKNLEKSLKIMKKEIKCLIIKFIFFFIICFSFLALFWYYISCFCAVYKNTQIYLIKDTLISFGLSLIYPFSFYLIPVMFRIPTLKYKDKCINWCYKISKIL